jgi:hypothetical protein
MKKFGKDSVMKKFWLDSKIINVEEADDELTIKGYASTSDVDRAGDVILPTACAEVQSRQTLVSLLATLPLGLKTNQRTLVH